MGYIYGVYMGCIYGVYVGYMWCVYMGCIQREQERERERAAYISLIHKAYIRLFTEPPLTEHPDIVL